MKNKKIIAMAAGLAALTVAGGSFVAYAAETDINKSETESYSYTTGKVNGAKYADADEQTDKSLYSYVGGQANGSLYADAEGAADDADKTDFSFNTGKANGTLYATETDTDKEVKTDYSYNAGQQNAAERNNTYSALPEGGTKEDAQDFYEQNDVGGGAWVDGDYDESAKTDYGYVSGQQRGASYAQETDGEATPDKSDYSYSTGRQSYEQDHESWVK